jgi:PAS domain S-box-containing protein
MTRTGLTHATRRSAGQQGSELQFRNLLSVAGVGVWILDADRRTTFANDALASMLRTNREAMLERNVSELLHGEAGRAATIILERTADRQPEQCELQLPGARGEGIWVLVSATPLSALDGFLGGVLAIVTDITARKLAEFELRRRAAVVDFSTDAILAKDNDCNVTEWNRAAERMYGYSAAEIIGRPVSVLVPEGRRGEEQAIIDRVLSGEEIDHYETQRLAKDGSVIEVSLNASAVRDSSGEIIGASSIARDITEQLRVREALRKSEELFRGGFEHSPIGMALENPDATVAHANTAFARMLGYDEPDELAGVALASITHPDDVPHDLDERRAMLDERKPHTTEKRFIKRDGEVVQVITACTVVSDSHGTPVSFFTQVEDVTERRRAEQRVTLRTAELQAANQELEAFAYSLAHDLRAPLRAIEGFGSVLSRRYGKALDDAARETLGRMRAASTRMGELIDAMLLLSELTRRELSPARVDLSAMAREISDELRARDPSRAIELVIEDGLETVGDPQLVRVLLVNLLENAWKFTSHSENARIEVAGSAPGVFAVRDNGAGFDMAFAGLLFKPFARLHREDEFSGTGIGLTTVQRIIRRHGGAVWGEGRPGGGATLYFKLEPQEETES